MIRTSFSLIPSLPVATEHNMKMIFRRRANLTTKHFSRRTLPKSPREGRKEPGWWRFGPVRGEGWVSFGARMERRERGEELT